jgi:hypothetical protein
MYAAGRLAYLKQIFEQMSSTERLRDITIETGRENGLPLVILVLLAVEDLSKMRDMNESWALI